MLTYVINLDRSPERWAYMKKMCESRDLPVRRVAATDGHELTDCDVRRLNSPEPGRRQLSKMEIACFQSHRQVWEHVAAGSEQVALVLEDDVYLAAGARDAIEAIARACPAADLIKLNNYRKPIYLYEQPLAAVNDYKVHRLPRKTIDASAYLIRRSAAKKLLTLFPPFPRELDIMLFDPGNGLVAAQVIPAISVQEKFADFSFLPPPASMSLLETTRAEENARQKALAKRRSIYGKIGAELRRFFRRRIAPNMLVITNLGRSTWDRLSYQTVIFERN